VDPVPDSLLRKSGAPGIEPGTSGFVARNSDHQITEAVILELNFKEIISQIFPHQKALSHA
jgi:hypothetical protein